MNESGGELDVLDSTGYFPGCVCENLAVFARHDRGEFGLPFDQQVWEPEKDIGTTDEAGCAPSGKCLAGRTYRGFCLGDRRQGHLVLCGPGGPVENRSGALRGAE